MKTLAWVFAVLAVYGLLAGHLGGAILAVLTLAIILVARRVFAAQDKAYNNDSAHAHAQPLASDALDSVESECSADKL